ncbi:MAG: hypothetical protein COT18_06820 [Elusimicrobia bacterium CG08_land_8_20_14_0_20_59_10]|nr:MAG: hypothetical protein COT18_06820 [Elusimicrobia bacterium CG08_land_8_20_14_0_20_59_10]
MKDNKDHWYDGWLYDVLIAPHQDGLFGQILELMEPGSKVIDIGCGTGRFSFSAAGKYRSVLGIDLSRRNIARANLLLSRKLTGNISFRHAGAEAVLSGGKEHYDYAVMTYVLHEVGEPERVKLLLAAVRAADKVILGDYLVPTPGGFRGALAEMVEFAAGPGHYASYGNFVSHGGLRGLAAEAGLNIVREIKNEQAASHLVLLTR